jgi:L-threonylcarbamoyladenylate synthase
MLESHYAPGARVEVVDATAVAERAAGLAALGQRVAVLTPGAIADLPPQCVVLGPVGGPDDYAARLYAAFRRADAEGADVIIAVPPPAEGIGVAVRDRLARAAAGR